MGTIMTNATNAYGNSLSTGQALERGATPVPMAASGPAAAGQTRNGEGGQLAAEKPSAEQWSRVKQRLRAELGEDVFTSWFNGIQFDEADKSSVYLSVPTRSLKSWIISHYIERVLALWQAESKSVARIELRVRGAVRARTPLQSEKAADAPAQGVVIPVPARPPAPAKRAAE
jgi:hypothetical protein